MSPWSLDARARLLDDGHSAQLLTGVESVCPKGLSVSSSNSRPLHLRGLMALKEGRSHFASACLSKALEMEPSNGTLAADYAEVLCLLGRHLEAIDAARQVLAVNPENGKLQRALARALLGSNCPSGAIEHYEKALAVSPCDARLCCELADALVAGDRRADAATCYEAANTLAPQDPEVCLRVGSSYLARSDWSRAIVLFRRGLEHQPSSSDLHVRLGEALLRSGAVQEATQEIRQGLALRPRRLDACRLLVWAAELIGQRDEIAEAWCCLGDALEHHDRFEESGIAYQQALLRHPNHLRALLGLGVSYKQTNRPAKSIPCLEAVLRIDPQHFDAHRRLGQLHALLGRLERHWDEDAWCVERSWRRFGQPAWDGSPLEGKTIFVWQSAGMGDAIQMMRFVPHLKALGARVALECERPLVPLVKKQNYVDEVTPRHTPAPHFDMQTRITSLPGILGTNLSMLPNDVPYLSTDRDRVERWSQRLAPDGRKMIGLAWAGHPNPDDGRLRFAPLSAFAPLAGLGGLRFISLQLGPQAEELIAPPRAALRPISNRE